VRVIAICLTVLTAACSESPLAPSSQPSTSTASPSAAAQDPTIGLASRVQGPKGCLSPTDDLSWLIPGQFSDGLILAVSHSYEPGCEATVEHTRTFTEEFTVESLANGHQVTYDPSDYSCGRIQIDVEDRATHELYIGLVVDYGSTCVRQPVDPVDPVDPKCYQNCDDGSDDGDGDHSSDDDSDDDGNDDSSDSSHDSSDSDHSSDDDSDDD